MIKNEATRLNANVILDTIRNDIDKAYMADAFEYYDSTEVALAIYHEHLKPRYSVEDMVRAFRFYRENGSHIYNGIGEHVFNEIGKLADEEHNEEIQKAIDEIPTFCDQ
jgi:hypothetical protein